MFRQVKLPENVKGSLHLHSMPGRYETYDKFIEELNQSDINLIISLNFLFKIEEKSPEYYNAIVSGYLPVEWLNYEIQDYDVPDDLEDFLRFLLDLRGLIEAGKHVLVHCGAGIGRTGLFAVCLLISLGLSKEEAFKRIISAGSNPEMDIQLDFIDRFEKAFKSSKY